MAHTQLISVTAFNNEIIQGLNAQKQPVTIAYTAVGRGEYASLKNCLFTGCTLSISHWQHDVFGRLLPDVIVLEPDYLIDISALAECVQAEDNSASRYFYNKLRPTQPSQALLLGNLANAFLDDIIHNSHLRAADFKQSIAKHYRDNCFEYLTCPRLDTPQGKASFLKQAGRHYSHIYTMVHNTAAGSHINAAQAVLEPAFMCLPMGLQGRLDLLQLSQDTGDDVIIELKSGKIPTIGGMPSVAAKNHEAQAMLYQLAIHFVLGRPLEHIHTYIFYSKYHTANLRRIRFHMGNIRRYLQLRNQIVATEFKLAADVNGTVAQKLFLQLNAPTITRITNIQAYASEFVVQDINTFYSIIQQAPPLVLAYCARFYAFIAKEQMLSKLGSGQHDDLRSVSSLWNADVQEKIDNGEMLDGLTLTDIQQDQQGGAQVLHLSLPAQQQETPPAFRSGDSAILYLKGSPKDNVLNQQIFKGIVIDITAGHLQFRLLHAQKNTGILPLHNQYALERDASDSSYSALYKGIYSFMAAPAAIQQLLLGTAAPRVNSSASLHYNYTDERLAQLLLHIKQADDYYLLLGPPGTGKTSVVIKNLIREFYAHEECNILLLSYTNRAVDEMCQAIEDTGDDIPYIRIGNNSGCGPAYRHNLLFNKLSGVNRHNDGSQIIAQHRVFAATVSSLNNKLALLQIKNFDVVIIDEASQILEPMLLSLLSATDAEGNKRIGKFIMVGDHKQLPALSLQGADDAAVTQPGLNALGITDARTSLFERLYRLHQQHANPAIISMLQYHGRMHRHIAHYVNTYYYGHKLHCVPLPHQQAPSAFVQHNSSCPLQAFMHSRHIGFFGHSTPFPGGNTKANAFEAGLIIQLLQALQHMYTVNNLPFHPVNSIGIITPYRAQIALIKQHITHSGLSQFADITVDTVERYQGSQRDIIIYAFSVWQPAQAAALPNLTTDGDMVIDRKLNVALTRARRHLYIIGNTSVLSTVPVYQQLIQYCQSTQNYYTCPAE